MTGVEVLHLRAEYAYERSPNSNKRKKDRAVDEMSDMPHHDHGHSDMGPHGMLLFGDRTIYLSHLPMFKEPHNFQVLLEVTLSSKGGDDQADEYRRDRHTSGERVYTLVPEKFPSLSELVMPSPDSPTRDSFTGTVVRGHFERGGRPIIEGVTVRVTKVVYFQELDPKGAPDPTATLGYRCFGKAGDLFAAHAITARPNFDQILAVSLPDPDAGKIGFDHAPSVTTWPAAPVEFEREDSPASRLTEGQEADGWFWLNSGTRGEHRELIKVRANAELYFESNELA